jgi:hypothetical protein
MNHLRSIWNDSDASAPRRVPGLPDSRGIDKAHEAISPRRRERCSNPWWRTSPIAKNGRKHCLNAKGNLGQYWARAVHGLAELHGSNRAKRPAWELNGGL